MVPHSHRYNFNSLSVALKLHQQLLVTMIIPSWQSYLEQDCSKHYLPVPVVVTVELLKKLALNLACDSVAFW
jgi:hypothetical protein